MLVVIRDAFVNTFHAELFYLILPWRVSAAPWSYIHSDSLPNNIPWGALIFNWLDNVHVF